MRLTWCFMSPSIISMSHQEDEGVILKALGMKRYTVVS